MSRWSWLSRSCSLLLVLAGLSLLLGLPAAPTPAHAFPRVPRGVYEFGHAPVPTDQDLKNLNFSVREVSWVDPKAELDALQALNMQGFLDLGGYCHGGSNCPPGIHCTFGWDDATVQSRIQIPGVAGHPALAWYKMADEPYASGTNPAWVCPTAPQQFQTRTNLIHSLDPSATVYVVVDPSNADGAIVFPYQDWVISGQPVFDLFGLEVYPCGLGLTCDYTLITQAISKIDSIIPAGLPPPRYLAVLEAFGVFDTPDTIHQQFVLWRQNTSRWEGYELFSYDWCATPCSGSFWDVPTTAQIQAENALGLH